MTAIMLAFSNDIRLKCETVGIGDGGALQSNFSMSSIWKSDLNGAAALKTLARCGIKMQHSTHGSILGMRVTMPYEVMSLSGVIFVRLTARELANLVCAVAKAMLGGIPVVTMKPLTYEPRCCATAVEVRYISEPMPDGGDEVMSVINLVAKTFNGDATKFSENIYGANAQVVLTLDYEDVYDDEEDDY